MKILNLDITRISHDAFRIAGSKLIYIDPFKIGKGEKADLILVSHEHFDHLSRPDLDQLTSAETRIIASPLCRDGLKGVKAARVTYISPGEKASVDGVEIEATPAYNVNKFREPGKAFHPKGEPRVGFLIRMDGVTIYHSGDTDFIPEMKSIRCDIALLPVSGTYVMTPEEAAEAAAAINPKVAIPMHYGAIVGEEKDAHQFQRLVKNCKVEIA